MGARGAQGARTNAETSGAPPRRPQGSAGRRSAHRSAADSSWPARKGGVDIGSIVVPRDSGIVALFVAVPQRHSAVRRHDVELGVAAEELRRHP